MNKQALGRLFTGATRNEMVSGAQRQAKIYDIGATVPTDADVGYAKGCIFIQTDGVAGTTFYVNEGTSASCDFNAAPLSAITATVAELNQLDGSILGAMTPGSGIVGTAEAAGGSVYKIGPMFKTEIYIDLTGLNSGTTIGDIIGKTLTANCHFGQITAAKNGTINYGQITCLETPAGGDPDVDFYGTITEATLAQDSAISAATGEALLLNNGDWTGAVATPVALTTLPGVGYLYLADGGGTAATYTAGKFLLELWGV